MTREKQVPVSLHAAVTEATRAVNSAAKASLEDPLLVNWRAWHVIVHAELGGLDVFVERGWQGCSVCCSMMGRYKRAYLWP